MYRRGGRNAFPFLLFLGGESMAIKIERVEAGSEAEALGLLPGDELLAVDQNELNDTLDYDFYTDSKSFHLKARVADGIREWDVQRAERGPFGCDFSTYLGDQKHSCSNHCMFCFIDQLPPGMRESLYFKAVSYTHLRAHET